MSVKVSLKEIIDEKIFPKLRIDEDGTIVLFTSKSQGTVVNNSQYYNVGYYSVLWCVGAFKDYNGEVTLKNE